MTNHWIDLKNADVTMVNGSNAAENHPASMMWINKGRKERKAKLLVVDPRFTRTAAKADLYVPLRSGTDIAFYGGLIKYAIDNKLYHEEYVIHYTNAANLISADFKGPEELDGLFSGFANNEGDDYFGKYDRATWAYQTDAEGKALRDETLQDPQCVFQIMKRHYGRYDLDTVSSITGTPKDKLQAAYDLYCTTGQPDKTGNIMYAMGQTQHTVGSQNVRMMGMIQLLLGNTGRPGGGVNALRGESNVQGSTDQGLLAHLVTGYLPCPTSKDVDLETYINLKTQPGGAWASGYWTNGPKFITSMLKAWWGENATADNEFGYQYLPKVDSAANHYWIKLFEDMFAGKIEGAWLMGQNPAVGGPNSNLEREALTKLKWMVIQEIFQTETVGFWQAPNVDPAAVQTEVFVLPAADAMEKEGSIVTSGRLIQWRPQVAAAPGEALPDHDILNLIYLRLKELYTAEPGQFADPILNLNWNYGGGPEHPVVGELVDISLVAREMNGYAAEDVVDAEGKIIVKKGDLIDSFAKLQTNGSTACGVWVYTGYYYPMSDGEGNVMPASKRRGQKDPSGLGLYPYYAYAWPLNRRIVYNRCSADPSGKPWPGGKDLIWWDAQADSGTKDAEGKPVLGKWVGWDVPDFVATRAPDAPGGKDPYIMRPDGKGGFFAAMNDGPLPTHYEPLESPTTNALYPNRPVNPTIKLWKTAASNQSGDTIGTPDQFPIIATTYRVCEHWQAGGMSRWLEWLVETHPEMFVELSEELAAEKGIRGGDMVKVRSARGEIEAKAIVTKRFKPFQVNGKTVHEIGMPWHFGWGGGGEMEALGKGAIANDLTPHVGDANTTIPEYKAFLVDVEKV
jgi:formate dehydrogenase major subunit